MEERYRWKDSVQSEPEIRLWVAEGTANGMRPWVTKFSGVLYDRRWLPVVERIYDWHFRHERYLRNEAPLARVALLFSEQTEPLSSPAWRPTDRQAITCSGCITRWSNRACPSSWSMRPISPDASLDRFKLLILADAAALSNAQCDAIRRFVTRGGSLLATFASSLYDEVGERRADFGLADVFGVSFAGRIEGPMQNCVSQPRRRCQRGPAAPVLDGFGDTTRIIHGVFRLDVKPRADCPSPLTLDPDLSRPAHGGRVSARRRAPTTRELYLRELGRSRVAYFPGTSIACSGRC